MPAKGSEWEAPEAKAPMLAPFVVQRPFPIGLLGHKGSREADFGGSCSGRLRLGHVGAATSLTTSSDEIVAQIQ